MTSGGIPREWLGFVWADLWRLIEPAYKRTDQTDGVAALLRSLEAQAWMVYDGPLAVAGIVTRFWVGTSGDRTCHLWLVGGSRLSEWAPDLLAKLIPWAKSEGCVAVTGNGRIGWDRIVRRFGGYRIEDRDGLPCWRRDL